MRHLMIQQPIEAVPDVRLTSVSGTYIVLTRSGAAYLVDLHDPDAAPLVTRFGIDHELPFDGQPLPGVMDLHFDITLGVGVLCWWKTDPATRRITPGDIYVGTIRRTSAPVWIGRILGQLPRDVPALVRQLQLTGRLRSGGPKDHNAPGGSETMVDMNDDGLVNWAEWRLPPPLEQIRRRILPGRWNRLEVRQGWWPLLVRLDRRLAAVDDVYALVEVSARDGVLRYGAVTDVQDIEFDDAIWEAMSLASRTCEVCGRPGRRHPGGAFGHITLCSDHSQPLTSGEIAMLDADGIPRTASAPGHHQAGARVAASNAFFEMIAGTHLDEDEVAFRLGISIDDVREIFARGDLAGANRDHRVVYPRWQFDTDDAVLPGLQRVLRAVPERWDAVALRGIMLRPSEDLHGDSPRDWLLKGLPVAAITAYLIAVSHEETA